MKFVKQSRLLSASDFPKPTIVTMQDVTTAVLGDDGEKWLVHFKEFAKPLALNVINGNFIRDNFGDETEDWKGQRIVCFKDKCDYHGKRVDCVRLRMPKAQTKPSSTPPPPAPEPPDVIEGEEPDEAAIPY